MDYRLAKETCLQSPREKSLGDPADQRGLGVTVGDPFLERTVTFCPLKTGRFSECEQTMFTPEKRPKGGSPKSDHLGREHSPYHSRNGSASSLDQSLLPFCQFANLGPTLNDKLKKDSFFHADFMTILFAELWLVFRVLMDRWAC